MAKKGKIMCDGGGRWEEKVFRSQQHFNGRNEEAAGKPTHEQGWSGTSREESFTNLAMHLEKWG